MILGKLGKLGELGRLGELGEGDISTGESDDSLSKQFPMVMICAAVDMLSKNRYHSLIYIEDINIIKMKSTGIVTFQFPVARKYSTSL
jgi:hypothetical protein